MWSLLACEAERTTTVRGSPQSFARLVANDEEQQGRFRDYWFDSRGEIAQYELSQARYGEIHTGEATLIFVAEPFSKSKQVKLDDWQNQSDRQDVLKLNFVKKFQTGVYPYSTMLSVFNTVNRNQRMVKLTNSVQEWCGQVFMQLNADKNQLHYAGYSYFEAEGDQDKTLEKVWTEDELWNVIRLDPTALPLGQHRIIPSTTYLRFNHHSLQVETARLSLSQEENPTFGNGLLTKYTIEYKQPEQRVLHIYFESNFPYTILGWEDTYEDIAWNSKRQTLTTTAKLKEITRQDYWNKNKVQHQGTLFTSSQSY